MQLSGNNIFLRDLLFCLCHKSNQSIVIAGSNKRGNIMSDLTKIALGQIAARFVDAQYSKLSWREKEIVDFLRNLDFLRMSQNRVYLI